MRQALGWGMLAPFINVEHHPLHQAPEIFFLGKHVRKPGDERFEPAPRFSTTVQKRFQGPYPALERMPHHIQIDLLLVRKMVIESGGRHAHGSRDKAHGNPFESIHCEERNRRIEYLFTHISGSLFRHWISTIV